MPTSRRLHAWLCVLLVLLQAVAPALHALQHHQAPAAGGTGEGGACACGQLHASPGTGGGADAAAPAGNTAAAHENCVVCEILRGLRVFDGPAARPEQRVAPLSCAADAPAPVSPRSAPRAQPFLARAPPRLLV